MEKKEPFSVCMSVYHGDDPKWLAQAVDSVRRQTALPDEIVFVVDGPVDSAMEDYIGALEEDPLFRLIRLEKNQGLGNARRVALENCSCPLVAMMDADDLCVSDRFEKQLRLFAEDSELSAVGGQIAEFCQDPENIAGIRRVQYEHGEIVRDLKKRCPMNHVTVMLRKDAVLKAGNYRTWYCNEDYDLWVRMYLSGAKFANSEDVLVNVRVGEDMYRRRGGWRYFCSEVKLQNMLLQNNIIGTDVYGVNVIKRLIVQLLLPNGLRPLVYRKFARVRKENKKL